MQPIPMPQVLDPDRILNNDRGDLVADHEARAQLLEDALRESCAYAQQLWHDLNGTRAYLLDSLPPDPRLPGTHRTASASPTGPDDDAGWDEWINVYAAVTSVLCGPHGDSGYGIGEGRREAELRRTAPVLRVEADHPDLGAAAHTEQVHTPEAASAVQPRRSRTARAAATVALVLLALRGLRRR